MAAGGMQLILRCLARQGDSSTRCHLEVQPKVLGRERTREILVCNSMGSHELQWSKGCDQKGQGHA